MTDFADHLERLAHECRSSAENLESGVSDVDDTEDLAGLLVMAQEATRAARAAESAVEQRLIECMGKERKIEVTGVGVVEKKRRTKYTQWDHDGLLSEIKKRAEKIVDPETGEVLADEGWGAFELLRCWASQSWRVGALKADGIQIDEYAHVEEDGWGVRVHA